MDSTDKSLIGLLDKIAGSLGGLDKIAACLCGSVGVPDDARSDPNEEVIIGYSEGHGSVRSDGRGVSLAATLTGISGEPQGQLLISWESLVKDEEEFRRRPKNPQVSLDESGPIEDVRPITRVQGRWSFNDGSSLTAVGVGVSSVSTVPSGRHNAQDAAALFVTGGTGRYEGASGLGTVVGTVPFPQGARFFNNPGFEVTQKTVHVFRLTGTSLKGS